MITALFNQISRFKFDNYIDTFSAVSSADYAAMSGAKLGKQYGDYESGAFWSRFWVGSGARREDMAACFPILLLERLPEINFCFSDNAVEQCREYHVTVLDLPQDDCKSPYLALDDKLLRIASTVARLARQARYIDGVWVFDRLGPCKDSLELGLPDNLEFKMISFDVIATVSGAVGVQFKFKYCHCSESPLIIPDSQESVPCPSLQPCSVC